MLSDLSEATHPGAMRAVGEAAVYLLLMAAGLCAYLYICLRLIRGGSRAKGIVGLVLLAFAALVYHIATGGNISFPAG